RGALSLHLPCGARSGRHVDRDGRDGPRLCRYGPGPASAAASMARRRSRAPALDLEPRTVELADAAFGGDGVGRLEDGRVVFVPRTLPGEQAVVQLVEERRDFARAELLSLERAVAGRVEAPCP